MAVLDTRKKGIDYAGKEGRTIYQAFVGFENGMRCFACNQPITDRQIIYWRGEAWLSDSPHSRPSANIFLHKHCAVYLAKNLLMDFERALSG